MTLRGLGARKLIARCATRRPDRAAVGDPAVATMIALRVLARRHQQLSVEIAELDALLRPWLPRSTRPARPSGVGTDVAGQLLVTAGDNPERLRSEAAFAMLAAPRRSRPPPVAPTVTGSTGAATATPTLRPTCRALPPALGPPHPRLRAAATTEGLSKPEIIRCLKRYIAREIYTALLDPQPSSVPAITTAAPN